MRLWGPLLLLLAGCALDTSVPDLPDWPVRWRQASLEVCAAPEYRDALEAARKAWSVTAGPETRVGCSSPDVVIEPCPAADLPVPGSLAHTVVTVLGHDEMISAVIDVAEPWNRDFDLQSAITHEFGHALGLGHVRDSAATMRAWQGDHDTSMRDLAPIDIEAARTLYH